jgi:EpsI family protein
MAVYVLLLTTLCYLNLHADLPIPMKTPLRRFPCVIGQWKMTGESQLSGEVQSVLRASDVLMRRYQGARGERVELYIGYHDGGKGSGEIHSPKHCLPGSGWLMESSTRTQIPVAGGKLNAARAVYRKGDDRQLFYYWFQVRSRSLSDEYAFKVAELVNSARHRRRDAALIRVGVPFQTDEQNAALIAERFVHDALPCIEAFLPK